MGTIIRVRDIFENSVAPNHIAYAMAPGAAPEAQGETAPDPVPPVGKTDDNGTPRWWVVAISLAVVVAAWIVGVNVIHDKGFTSTGTTSVVEGLTIFAVFFVGAQALERLLEPIFVFVGADAKDSVGEAVETAKTKLKAAAEACRTWAQADEGTRTAAKSAADTAVTDATDALNAAALATAKREQVKGDKSVSAWAIATALGVISASALKLYLLRTVGIASPPRALEILATGLILGSGTKPLHDLVSMIETKKEAAAAAANSAG